MYQFLTNKFTLRFYLTKEISIEQRKKKRIISELWIFENRKIGRHLHCKYIKN